VLAWASARDAALRGLVHALSNRVGTVGAVAAMLEGAAPQSVDTAARILAGEGERLEAVLAHLRLATADPFADDAGAEAVHVADVLADVAALAHYAAPDVAVRVEGAAAVRPAVAPRTALVQALLAGVVGAARDGAPGVVLRADDAGPHVVLRVTPGAADGAEWLLAGAGVAAVDADGAWTLRLPALGG
jgi:nitrogen-specific signal transduction histidine kinase